MYELVLKEVFIKMLNIDEKSPEVLLFKNFQTKDWNNIDREKYASCLDDPEIPAQVKNQKSNLLDFATDFLKVSYTFR